MLHFSVFSDGSLDVAANINLGPQGASLTNPPFGPHLLHIRSPLFSVETIQHDFRVRISDLGLPRMSSSSTNPILEPTIFACSSPPDPCCVPIHCLSVIRGERGRTRCCRRRLLQGEVPQSPPAEGEVPQSAGGEVPQCPIVTGGGP